MRRIRILPPVGLALALAITATLGPPALADDHEDRYGPLVVGQESTSGAGFEELFVEWEWEHADGSLDYVYLFIYDDVIQGGTGTCTDAGDSDTCTSDANLADNELPPGVLDIDFDNGTATVQWSTTSEASDGTTAACTLDVTATFEADAREPSPSSPGAPRVRQDGRVELVRRSGSVTKFAEGTAAGTICGWELAEPPTFNWALAYQTERRTDTTYVEIRPS